MKYKIIGAVVIIAILAAVFWYGGGAPGLQGWGVPERTVMENTPPTVSDTTSPETDAPQSENPPADTIAPPKEIETTPEEIESPKETEDTHEEPEESPEAVDETPLEKPGAELDRHMTTDEKLELAKELAGGQSSEDVTDGDENYSESQGMEINESTGKDKYLTDPVPEGKPVPVEPQDMVISDKELSCRLSVRCDTILDNMEWLDKEKWELVPDDGVIFPETTVTFYEGESVFNVLQREMKRAKIHMEFVNTPMYNSAYIEGINNLYEFDVGELSGWMYKVNDWFPNYGCSRYLLRDGDVIEWVYTCNLGVDVGGYYAVGG